MPEQYTANPEVKFVDKTVTKIKEMDVGGVKCKLELHALPDKVEDDLELSVGVTEDIVKLLREKGVDDATINLTVGSSQISRREKEPYRLTINVGKGSDSQRWSYSKQSTWGDSVEAIVDLPSGTVGVMDYLEVSQGVALFYVKKKYGGEPSNRRQWGEGKFTSIK